MSPLEWDIHLIKLDLDLLLLLKLRNLRLFNSYSLCLDLHQIFKLSLTVLLLLLLVSHHQHPQDFHSQIHSDMESCLQLVEDSKQALQLVLYQNLLAVLKDADELASSAA